MTAVLGGLGAAVAWAVTLLCTARAAQLLGSRSTLAWVMALGLVVAAPLAAGLGTGPAIGSAALAWLALSGAANVIGLLFQYRAMRAGRIGVVAQICSAEGMVATSWAVVGGERLGAPMVICCAAIVAGLVLTVQPHDGPAVDRPDPGSGWVVRAALAALMFGTSLYALARAGSETSVFVAVLPARVLGTVFFALPLLARRALRIEVRAVPLVIVAAVGEVGGALSFAAGARDNIAIAAMIAAQFAAAATVGAFFLYRERMRPRQVAGVVVIAIGVGALAALGP